MKDTVGIPAYQLDAVIRIMKAEPGTTAENYNPVEKHTHKAESEFTVIEKATSTSPGIRVKYCTVCGSYIPATIEETP